jgi:integrase/recombinase XerD
VVAVDESVPWLVGDDAGVAVEPIYRYLGDLAARRRSASSTRSYAYDLLRWWRWLRVIGIDWDKTTSADEGLRVVAAIDTETVACATHEVRLPPRAPSTRSLGSGAWTISIRPGRLGIPNALLRHVYEFEIRLSEKL